MRRLMLAFALSVCGALALDACGSTSDTAGILRPESDAGSVAVAMSCVRTTDCTLLNAVCVHTAGAASGLCVAPTGRCDPELSLEGQCYPNARCDLSMQTPAGEGNCSFTPPSRSVFPVDSRIELEQPTLASELFPTSGFSFQWQPFHGATGTISVVMVTSRPPVFDAITGQITNWANVTWAWSTAEPGTSGAMDGTVPVRAGRRGVSRSGSLGAPWGRDTFDAGRYWWFVYAIKDGAVTATSVAQAFVVGAAPMRPQSCTRSDQCVIGGDVPDLVECYAGACRRRCASDFDCLADGTRCDFGGPVVQSGSIRRGAYCATTNPSMNGDAGVPDAPM